MLAALEVEGDELDICDQIGDRNEEANYLGNLGITYRSLQECDKAASYYRQNDMFLQAETHIW